MAVTVCVCDIIAGGDARAVESLIEALKDDVWERVNKDAEDAVLWKIGRTRA